MDSPFGGNKKRESYDVPAFSFPQVESCPLRGKAGSETALFFMHISTRKPQLQK